MAGTGSDLRETRIVWKVADTTLQNDNVLGDDPHLQVAIAANEIYLIDLTFIIEAGGVGGGFKGSLNGPAAPTNVSFGVVWGRAGNIGGRVMNNYEEFAASPVGDDTTYWFHGIIENGVNSGTLAARIAQFVAHADTTIVKRGSYMKLQRIGG